MDSRLKGGADVFDIAGQVAVVTGGNGVLGKAMARFLAERGAKVAILSRKSSGESEIVHEICASGGEAIGVACDVLERASVEQAASEVEARLGPVEILVNGAGGNQAGATTNAERSFFELEGEALNQVLGVNFLGTVQCCQVFGRGMAERGHGCIVNIASMSAMRPLTRVPAYSAAKAAVVNFTQWLAVHMAQEYSAAIRVNAISPGFFLTEQNRTLLIDKESGGMTARGQAIVEHTPMHRLGDAGDLLGTLLWLVSPASAFVTGVVVPVDGGFSAFAGV